MSKTVGDQIVTRLAQWGVTHVFGYPGDGINGLMRALNRGDHGCRFVQARHEETAALMACGYAKLSGRVGVCVATSGPGAIHLLNGLYDAKMDRQPVVAIVGQEATGAMGGSSQQEVDLHALFKDVAGEYVHTAMSPDPIRFLVDRAFRTAASERCPTCLIVPTSVQEMDAVESPPHEQGAVHSSVGYSAPRVLPQESELKRAAEVLSAGEKIAILVGIGAKDAVDEVLLVQDLTGGGIAKALLGRAVLADDLPFVTGPIGLLGSKPSWDMMVECDTLLTVGSSFPYSQFLPKEGQANGVQIDLDPKEIGLRSPMDVCLVGDAKATLGALIPYLKRKTDRTWENRIKKNVAAWRRSMDDRAHVEATPMNPQRVFWELSPKIPDKAILCADSGSAANWFARDIKVRRGMMASVSGSLATMGCGVPYAISAKFARPDRPVIAFVGDGAMQMNGMAELLTIKKYWKEWKDPRMVILVLHTNDLELPEFDYASFAESIGLRGIKVDRSEQIAPAWDEALASPMPVVLDAIVAPDAPPLPPHITLKQMQSFGVSLSKP